MWKLSKRSLNNCLNVNLNIYNLCFIRKQGCNYMMFSIILYIKFHWKSETNLPLKPSFFILLPQFLSLSLSSLLISFLFQIFIGPIPTFVHEKYAHEIYNILRQRRFSKLTEPGQLSRHCSLHNSISRKIGSRQLGKLGYHQVSTRCQ